MLASVQSGLLERDDELEHVEAALAQARAGRGRFVVVEGPAGIGKTALLAAARTAAADEGMRVLRARANELERDFVFGVVRQLFEPPLAEATKRERIDLLQGAAGVAASLLALPGPALPAGPLPTGIDPSFAILHGLYWLCVNLTASGPLYLSIDDAQWADIPSLRFLAFMLPRLEELNVAVVVAARPREAVANAELLAGLTTDADAEVIQPLPLTGAGVARLIDARLGSEPDPEFVDACLRATRGTPFLVHELAGALAEEGIAPSAESAPHVERIGARTVGRSIRLRLGRLPEPAARLARVLAVLEQSDLQQAARLAELTEAHAADAADLLASAGIVDPGRPLRFIHPIVRAALYADLSGAERAHGHLRAARLLAEHPDTLERVSQHLLLTEPAADPWVVQTLGDAGRGAARNGAPESAAVFLRRALQEPPPPAEQPGLLLELGVAEASAGLAGWQEHLQQAVDIAPDAAAAAGAARELARAFNRSQCFAEAVEVLDRAASALPPGHDELALQLEAAAVVSGMNDLTASHALALRRDALRERVAVDPAAEQARDVLGAAAYISILANEPVEVGAGLAVRALAGDAPRIEATFVRPFLALLWAERYAELLPQLDSGIAEAQHGGDSGRLAVGLAVRSWVALRHGDLCVAESDARAALAATELPAPRMYRVLNAGLLIDALLELGELGEAAQISAQFDDEAERGSLTASVLRLARGRLRVAEGRVAEGLDDFLAVGDRLTRASVSSPGFLAWRSEAALAHLALGEQEHAARLADDELELARAFGAPRAIGVAARAAGVVAGGDRGELLLRESIVALEHGNAPLERARALADLGAMLRRRNRRAEARELLREAVDAAHHAGATRLAERAEIELRATGARPRRLVIRGLGSLTASERRIAEYASRGLTNREIAQTLFVTTRTVEGHLTSIFRKLQLDSRSDLHAALAAGTSSAA